MYGVECAELESDLVVPEEALAHLPQLRAPLAHHHIRSVIASLGHAVVEEVGHDREKAVDGGIDAAQLGVHLGGDETSRLDPPLQLGHLVHLLVLHELANLLAETVPLRLGGVSFHNEFAAVCSERYNRVYIIENLGVCVPRPIYRVSNL